MAPEVWAGRNYTAQADIFSMGVLFWAVLERITFLEDGCTHEQLGELDSLGLHIRSTALRILGDVIDFRIMCVFRIYINEQGPPLSH